MVDWERIKTEYVSGKGTQKDLAYRHKVTRSAIAMRAARENWRELRSVHLRKLEEESERLIRMEQENLPEEGYRSTGQGLKEEKMEEVSTKLLTKISQAIDELDCQILREVRKEKEVTYDHPQRPDKVTKEILVEQERLTRVRSTVDRNGIKLLAAALKDMKEVMMLRDPVDLREQEAKIAKMEKEAQETKEENEGQITVIFSSETEACSL